MQYSKHVRFFLTLLYIALGALAVWLVFKYALKWFAPFIIAFVASKIIEKPTDFLKEKLRFPRPLAAGLLTVLFYGIICTVFYFVASAVVNGLVDIFEHLRALNINAVVAKLNDTFVNVLSRLPLETQDFIYSNVEAWLSDLVSALQNLIGPMITSATNLAIALPSIILFVIAAIVSTYFLACDYRLLRRKLADITPMKWRLRYRQTREQVSTTLVSYLRALLVLISITFVELAIGLAVLRVPGAILLAAVIALIDAMPILGTGWVLGPWAIVALCMQNYVLAIGLIVIYIVVLIVRNILEPKIVGKHIGLHPLVTLISMYVGLKMFGIIGMFMPIPIALIKQFYEWGYFDFLKRTPKTEE